jgi:hypothetical protein
MAYDINVDFMARDYTEKFYIEGALFKNLACPEALPCQLKKWHH